MYGEEAMNLLASETKATNSAVRSVLDAYLSGGTDSLIPILQQVQSKQGYISQEAVGQISKRLRISKSRVFGVASFYSQFRFNPPGRHSIKICLGSACHVQGGDFLLNALELEIGIGPGQTTEDGRFDLERLACLGCCALAPVMMVNEDIHSQISVTKLKHVLMKYE
jgi:NADH-quinone oxidoreductase subunit E